VKMEFIIMIRNKVISWPTKKLEEICEIRTGKKDVNEGDSEGKYPFFTCSREISHSDTYSFDTEAILVAGNGDVGATKYYKGKFEAYQRTYVLDQFKEGDIRFIYYFILAGLKKKLLQDKSGSTMPYVRKGDLASFEIFLPPLIEQRKIVYVLDSIQEAVRVQEKIIEKTKELKRSLMQKLFREGAPSFSKGRKLKKTEIGEMPENWNVVKVKNLGAVITGTTPSTSVVEYWGGNIPFVTPSDFNEGVYVFKTERCVSDEGAKKGKLIPRNSVLVVCIGSTLGKIALTFKECVTNQQINSIVCDTSRVNPFFVYYFLLKKKFLLRSYAGMTAKPIVKKSLFESFPIALPLLPEQCEIADILQTVDKKIEIEQKKKTLYEELFKSMLNQLMTGKIRVNNINFLL